MAALQLVSSVSLETNWTTLGVEAELIENYRAFTFPQNMGKTITEPGWSCIETGVEETSNKFTVLMAPKAFGPVFDPHSHFVRFDRCEKEVFQFSDTCPKTLSYAEQRSLAYLIFQDLKTVTDIYQYDQIVYQRYNATYSVELKLSSTEHDSQEYIHSACADNVVKIAKGSVTIQT